MKILRMLPIFLMLVFVATACPGDTPDDPTNKCDDVTCETNEVCLPSTGKCVPKDEDKCKDVTCDVAGEVCDPDDGLCKGGDTIDSISKLRKIGAAMSKDSVVDGATLTTKLDGIVIAVKGINTSKKHGAYVCEPGATEYACLYVDFHNIKGENFVSPEVGATVKVKGKHVEYHGETQISPQTAEDFEITGSGTVPAAIELKADGFEEKYESMLVSLKDAPFTVTLESDTNADPARYDTEMKDANGLTFKMSSSIHYPYYELPTGTELSSVKGVLAYSYGEYKMFPRFAEDLGTAPVLCGTEECTDAQHCENDTCVANVDENTEELCNDGISNDGDRFIDCDDHDCDGTDVCKPEDKCEGVDCTSPQVCSPATGLCVDPGSATSIADVRAGADDAIFTTEGVVTAVINKGFYMQDATGGIYVYTNSAPTVALAEKVKLEGTKTTYNGLEELKNVTIESHVADTMPAFTSVDAANIADLEAQESMLVEFANAPFTVVSVSTGDSAGDYVVKDSNNKEFIVRSSYFEFTAVANDTFSALKGIIKYSYGAYKLYPRVAEDMGGATVECDPVCGDWQHCEDNEGTAVCKINTGRCDAENACTVGTCNLTSHRCVVEGTDGLTNGDLETWADDNTATGWLASFEPTIEKESTIVHNGFSAKVTMADDAERKPEFLSPPMNVDVSKTYTISIFVNDNDNKVKARVYYRFYDIEGNSIGTGFTDDYSADSADWTEMTKTTDALPAAAATIRAGVRVYYTDAGTSKVGGTLYVDDLTITEVSK